MVDLQTEFQLGLGTRLLDGALPQYQKCIKQKIRSQLNSAIKILE